MVTAGNVIMAYFASWSIYDRAYNPWDVDGSRLSHLNYAFANIKDGVVVLGDPYADSDKVNTGRGDAWTDPADSLHGNLHQFFLLKQTHRHLKLGLSIGGWSWSSGFHSAADNERSRKRFVASAIQMVHDYGFDYIDLDWEFPVVGGLDPSQASANDGRNYVALLKEFDVQLRQHFPDSEQRPFITLAMSCSSSVYNHYLLAEMEPYVALFSLMSYDFSGPWSPAAEHHANLRRRDPIPVGDRIRVQSEHSVEDAVQSYLAKGIPANKLVMGIPLYGRQFESCLGLQHPFQEAGQGTWGESGLIDYKVMPLPGFIGRWERTCNASFAINPIARKFISYDDPKAVAYKLDYIRTLRLAGAMFWEISADHPTGDPRSILRLTDQWIGGNRLDRSKNNLCYPLSRYSNVRGQPGCPAVDLVKLTGGKISRNMPKRPDPQALDRIVEICRDDLEKRAASYVESEDGHAHAVPCSVNDLIECYLTQFSEYEEPDDPSSASSEGVSNVDDSLIELLFDMLHLDENGKAKKHQRLVVLDEEPSEAPLHLEPLSDGLGEIGLYSRHLSDAPGNPDGSQPHVT